MEEDIKKPLPVCPMDTQSEAVTACESVCQPKTNSTKKVLKIRSKKISKKISKKVVVGIQCDYCTKVFDKPQGLGGHISKSHPGRSKVYTDKMITRENRAPLR